MSASTELCAVCTRATDPRGALGVDVGTTTTLFAAWDADAGAPAVLYNSAGKPWCASVPVYAAADGAMLGLEGLLRGDAATRGDVLRLRGVKRVVGAPFSDPRTRHDVDSTGALRAYGGKGAAGVEGASDVVQLHVAQGVARTPLTVTQDIVRAALDDVVGACTCSARLPVPAVVTVPADFTPLQRAVTAEAAERAGLRVLQLVNEPTAALLHAAARGAVPPPSQDHVALVFDWGGGTFDATVLTPDVSGVAYDVVASAGDAHLGGADVDEALAQARGISRAAAVRAKEGVATESTTFVDDVAVTRQHVLDAAALSVRRAVQLASGAVARAQYAAQDITHVVLVGGSSALPGVHAALRAAFPAASVVAWHTQDTRTCVARGAAWLAAQLTHVIPESTTPAQGGAGPATAAAAPTVHDALTHSIGVQMAGKYAHRVLQRDAPLPAAGSATFTTQRDGQVFFDVRVFAGEATLTEHCAPLGAFRIQGVPPAPAGAQRVRITLRADASGTLRVSGTHGGSTVERTMHLLSAAPSDGADDGVDTVDAAQDAVAQEHMRLWNELWSATVRAKSSARAVEGTPYATVQDVVDSAERLKTVCDVQHDWMRVVSARELDDADAERAAQVDDMRVMRERIKEVASAADAHSDAVHVASLHLDVFLAAQGDNVTDAADGEAWLRRHGSRLVTPWARQ